ncbi:uncharacterized protein LOC144146534 [Haemaphysalis longicornis]
MVARVEDAEAQHVAVQGFPVEAIRQPSATEGVLRCLSLLVVVAMVYVVLLCAAAHVIERSPAGGSLNRSGPGTARPMHLYDSTEESMKANVVVPASFLLLLAIVAAPVRCANKPEEAVVLLKAENATPVFFCAANIPAIKSIPKEEEEAEFHPFLNMVNETECDYERRAFEGKLVLVDRCKNTTNDELIEQAKSAKAAGVLVSVNAKKSETETKTNIRKLDIVVAFVSNETAHKIALYEEKHNDSSLTAKIFAATSTFDGSFLVIWLIAMGTVVTGSYWSGIVQQEAYAPKSTVKPETKAARKSKSKHKTLTDDDFNAVSSTSLVLNADKHSDFTESTAELEGEFTMPLSPKLVIMFVIHMSVMLLTLYYFYVYLIYLIIIMFGLASAAALISCLEPIVNRMGIGSRKVPAKLAGCCHEPMEIRHVALAVFAFSLAVVWYFLRNNDAVGWALQDILGVAFCINMLKSIHLPNLRLLCLLLSLLLVYDVFFVFITPFLQANRESVMVEVAKGGSLKEALPMVVRFPKLVRGKFHMCFASKYSLLGLGDILAPGLLLSYCHAFDLLSLGRRFYFYITCAAYGVGMVVTFLALHLMRNAQPALLYLVPCTILPTVVAAWSRGELFHIWNGLRLNSPATSTAVEAERKPSKAAPSNHKSTENSETDVKESPGSNDDAPDARKKHRRNKRSRRTSQGTPKSVGKGGSAKETVVAEGDAQVAVTRAAFLLDAAEHLMMPSPSALPPDSSKPTRASGEDAAVVSEGMTKLASPSYQWEEPVAPRAKICERERALAFEEDVEEEILLWWTLASQAPFLLNLAMPDKEAGKKEQPPARKPRHPHTYENRGHKLATLYVMTAGSAHVTQFPMMFIVYGGAPFLLAYLVFLGGVAYPMMRLESNLAQFAGDGNRGIFSTVPFFIGVGYSMTLYMVTHAVADSLPLSESLRLLFLWRRTIYWPHECPGAWLTQNSSCYAIKNGSCELKFHIVVLVHFLLLAM